MEHAQSLLDCIERLPKDPKRGFRFIDALGEERFYSYRDLEKEAKHRAAVLYQKGLKKGDRLALVIPDGHEFVLSFLGAVAGGIIPVPIFPRATFKAIESYHDTVAHILQASTATMLLSTEAMKPYLEPVLKHDVKVSEIATVDLFEKSDVAAIECPALGPEDLCFLQFTSGSTSKPKGVMVSHGNLLANARAFLGPHGLDRRKDDLAVSWLPLYHDMGLIGFILGTLVMDIPVVIFPTASFARNPRLWLETINKHKATLTFAPNFAYALVAKRVRDADLSKWDLSSIRVSGCGAEPINATTLRAFADRLKPAGFNANAFLPYGMAEATLAITFSPQGQGMKTDRVDAKALQQGKAAPATDATETTLELVSCGKAFPEHELAIVDEQGNKLAERQVGEIITQGPSITKGYYQNPEASAESWKKGWLHTGDLGYIAEGNLFICGRSKDLIIINGANHYPQDLEWQVDSLPGVRRNNVVAFSSIIDGEERLVMVAEGNSGDAASLRHDIASRITETTGLKVHKVAIVPVGTLPKTSSGKAQRRKTKQLFEKNVLPEHL
ncbi:MAG: fatty acyl-AMP ligase [Myxococcales bacterium]|nr:MAG: fatty acyl-AMP ligase [Myxococcales bacterium]